jgi:hypothetical protein
MSLFKIKLQSNIRDLPDKLEYLRCSNKKILEIMFKQCFALAGSMYYGYHKYTITKITLSDIPEVRQIKVKSPNSKSVVGKI